LKNGEGGKTGLLDKKPRTKSEKVAKSQKSDGTVKSFRCKARKSDGMRRTYLYAAMNEDAAPVFVHRTEATPKMDFLRSRQI
jgi:hypothetical protein